MELNEKLQNKIKEIFKNNINIQNRLLSGDYSILDDAIGYCERGFSADEIIKAYESNSIDDLYMRAKKQKDIINLYSELTGKVHTRKF